MFIGIDIGSISAKMAILDTDETLVFSEYMYHRGNPVGAVSQLLGGARVRGVDSYLALCATGSGRNIIGRAIGAALTKNEITASWRAAIAILPGVRTYMEIGGQDSKLIVLDGGEIVDFRLNSVCAAGTGSFIEQQANRLGISLEALSSYAAGSRDAAKFTGRCTVFVETEMINLQQRGYPMESIAAGLFDAICENYLNDLAPGMKMQSPVMFCGGVSEIRAVKTALGNKLHTDILVPDENRIAAAYGAALLAAESWKKKRCGEREYRRLPAELPQPEPPVLEQCHNTDCLSCGLCIKNKPS